MVNTSGIHPIKLPTSTEQTPATDSSAQLLTVAFSADSAERATPPRPDAQLSKPRVSLALQARLLEAGQGIGSMPQNAIRSGGSCLERLDLPLSDVVASSALLTLKNGNGAWSTFDGGQIQARHEPKYNLIRCYIGRSREVMNINLTDDGKTVRGITGHPPVSPSKLQRLVTAGLLSPGLLPVVGTPQDQVKITSESNAEDQQLTLRFQTHHVKELPDIEKYSGKDQNTKLVGQGEAHFLSSVKSDVHGLYTVGAGPCLILIAVDKNALGKAEKVAMAHVDAYAQDQAINQFFGSLHASGKVEVTLLAGKAQVAKRAIEAADKAGAAVVFAHAGHEPVEAYSAAVDRDGTIYFGDRLSLINQVDTNKTANRIMKSLINGGELPIFEQLPAHFHI